MGSHAQVPRDEFVVEPLDRILEPCSLQFEPEVAKAPLEQLLVRTCFPGLDARHQSDSIPQASLASGKFGVDGRGDDVVYG